LSTKLAKLRNIKNDFSLAHHLLVITAAIDFKPLGDHSIALATL
jgi:hypothetical protein